MGAGRNRPGVSLPPFYGAHNASEGRRGRRRPCCLSQLSSFLRDLGGWFRCLLRLLFRGELLLHLEGDGIGVHLVHGSGLVEHLSGVMPSAHVEDGGFNQDTAQHTLFGTTEIGRKELAERVGVFRLLDAVPAGNDGQTVFVQQGSQPFGDEEQVTFHQPHRNGFGDGGEGSRAWGYIFERYVNWWGRGRSFKKALTYYPFPLWTDKPSQKSKKRKVAPVEAFDAVMLESSRMVVLECKGGFLTLDAKHSLNMRLLLRDLNKKFAKACRQLAKAIGELFGIVAGRTLQHVPTGHVTRVVPVIVVQDAALRSLGINWWLNRQFQRMMRLFVLRPGVTVEPVTIVHIDEFETMIDSAEGPEFDFVGTLQLRNFRDAECMSDLLAFLLHATGYGAQHSSRRKELEDEFKRCVLEYAFDPEGGDPIP
jgi:hypothetical protein